MPKYPRPSRTLLCILFCCLGAQSTARDLLPETPSESLRITVEVSCDFEERWWEVAFYPGGELPLEFRSRDPVAYGRRDRESQRAISSEERDELYEMVLTAFAEFRIDRRPRFQGPGAERDWTGERTISLAVMTLDDELGRVDRLELSLDVLRGRALPEASLALVDRIASFSRLARLELECD